MLILIFALASAQPAPPPAETQPALAQPVAAVAPAHVMTRRERREAYMNQVRCHPVETLSGIAEKACVTNRDWERRQREAERQVSDFQTRSLSSPY